MAYDLVFGQIARNWSSGAHLQSNTSSTSNSKLDDTADMPTDALAEATRSEIAKNASLAMRLNKERIYPDAEYEGFKKFHDSWMTYSSQHQAQPGDNPDLWHPTTWFPSTFGKQDKIALWNFREINKPYTERLTKLAQHKGKARSRLSPHPHPQSVSSIPEASASSVSPDSHPVTSSIPWLAVLGIGLSVGALVVMSAKGTPSPARAA